MRRHCAQLRPIVGILRLIASRRFALRPWAACAALLFLSAAGSQSAMAQAPGPGVPAPPVIQNFGASQIGPNMWKVTGQVVCADPAYVTVTFGGLLDGMNCATDEYGFFTYGFYLMTGMSGYVSAQAMDHWAQQSAVVQTYILND